MCELRQDHWLLWLTYKKLIILYISFLIVVLVLNFVVGMFGRWYVVGASLKEIPESFQSLY